MRDTEISRMAESMVDELENAMVVGGAPLLTTSERMRVKNALRDAVAADLKRSGGAPIGDAECRSLARQDVPAGRFTEADAILTAARRGDFADESGKSYAPDGTEARS
jgi:ketopantoate reductase